MKKVLLSFALFYLTSMAAVAGNELTVNPGDPKKEKEKESTFSLADGYFSLFNFFFTEETKVDTTTFRPSKIAPRKESALKQYPW